MMIGLIIAQLKVELSEREAFKKLCKTLPKEQSDFIKATRIAHQKEQLEHYRNLEVARESRSLNFWGSR